MAKDSAARAPVVSPRNDPPTHANVAKAKTRILIAVPSLLNRINSHLARFMGATLTSNNKADRQYHFDWYGVGEIRPHEYARNLICGYFLQGTWDKLWMIDDDLIPCTGTTRLLDLDADIASALYYVSYDPFLGVVPLCFESIEDDGLRGAQTIDDQDPDLPRIRDVAAMGTGALLIRRHVIEDQRMWLPRKYVSYFGDIRDVCEEQKRRLQCARERNEPRNFEFFIPPIFRTIYTPWGEVEMSEDIDFSHRAKQLGYSLKVHMDVVFGHLKTIDINRLGRRPIYVEQPTQLLVENAG